MRRAGRCASGNEGRKAGEAGGRKEGEVVGAAEGEVWHSLAVGPAWAGSGWRGAMS